MGELYPSMVISLTWWEKILSWHGGSGSRPQIAVSLGMRDEVGDVRVSTVFLGIDHNFGKGPPLLFETMVFGGNLDQTQERCSTWEEAEEQHRRVVERAGIYLGSSTELGHG